MKIFAYSKALYSSWFYLDSLRLLLDAGEGVNFSLEGRLLAIRDIALTHAHTDHFTGLQNIFVTRLREMEMAEQAIPPLQLIYPEDSTTIQRYLAYLADVTERWNELVILRPTKPGDSIPLSGVRGLFLDVQKAEHTVYRQTCLAYRIDQERHVLRPEYAQLPQAEINRMIAKEGRESVTFRQRRPIFFFSGDSRPLCDPTCQDIPLMLHEATFLEPTPHSHHSSLPEVMEIFRKLNPRYLLLFHLSTRYEFKDFLALLDSLVQSEDERERIFAIRPGSLFQKDIPFPGF